MTELKTGALTNLARVKSILEIATGTAAFDTLLERYINQASDFVEGQCNRIFKQATYTDEKISNYAPNASFIFLKQTPIVSITNLKYKIAVGSYQAYGSTEYEIEGDGKSGVVRMYGGVSQGTNALTCTYLAGYLIDFTHPEDATKHTLPADLTGLVEALVVKAYKNRMAKGKSNESAAGDNVSFKDTLDEDDKMILARYTRPPQFV